MSQQSDSPIIPNEGGGKMGRIRPGSRLAVRAATREEIIAQWDRATEDDNPFLISPYAWFVVFADEPDKVLHDWFSPVGGWYRDAAEEEAKKYARARGAEVVELTGNERRP